MINMPEDEDIAEIVVDTKNDTAEIYVGGKYQGAKKGLGLSKPIDISVEVK